ncbi:MAG: pyridoxine 5'-phosphate synthase, partial [Neisseriaceae bacterium]|nr:pyridoxine 5'-phosphate synthase [Neisseriaceae bacterium]
AELNIGHAIIAQALVLGLAESVKQMKTAIFQAKALAMSNEQ